jgi:hypothetical protein
MNLVNDIQKLYSQVSDLIQEAKTRVAVSANAEVTIVNWKTGVFINDFILQGNRAEYGKQIISNLSGLLTENFGSGWSAKHLMHCLRVAECFSEKEIVSAVQRQLSWTHLKTISYEKDVVKRNFYIEMSVQQRWNTRTLSGQMDKLLFERTAIANKPDEQIQQALTNLETDNFINPDLFFKSRIKKPNCKHVFNGVGV